MRHRLLTDIEAVILSGASRGAPREAKSKDLRPVLQSRYVLPFSAADPSSSTLRRRHGSLTNIETVILSGAPRGPTARGEVEGPASSLAEPICLRGFFFAAFFVVKSRVRERAQSWCFQKSSVPLGLRYIHVPSSLPYCGLQPNTVSTEPHPLTNNEVEGVSGFKILFRTRKRLC